MISPDTVAPGQTITYTLAYANHGPQLATDVVITDIVPISVTSVSYDYAGAVILHTGSISYTWRVPNLAKDEGGFIIITGVLSTGLPAGHTFINTATITGSVVDANVEMSGGGRATVNPSGRLDVNASGGSHVYYVGNPTLGDIDTSGGSSVERE